MPVPTFTKTGSKAATQTTLDKDVFNVKVESHDTIKQAYVAYLANGRINLAITKKRGQVRGGGRKPWRQKGTGRARFGSIRTPIWRGGGITFGPSGNENYSHRLTPRTKKLALKQALSVKQASNVIMVVEDILINSGKTKDALALLTKIGATKKTLIVTDIQDPNTVRAFSNLQDVKIVQDTYLNVYDVINSDHIIITKKALPNISNWLGGKQ